MTAAISGCATATHGPKQRVIVSTPGAPKAECTLKSHSLGVRRFTTPEAIDVPRSDEAVEISCHKKCFHDETKTFSSKLNAEELASNGFFGGFGAVGPIAIDLATKKAYDYTYDFIIEMKSNGQCRSKRKGFLDGDPKDFDNNIKDFSFDESPKPLPEISPEDLKTLPAPATPEKDKAK